MLKVGFDGDVNSILKEFGLCGSKMLRESVRG